MEIKQIPITEITPYSNNPRNNDGAVKYVANSIKRFGWKQPIVLDSNNTIVAGHTRYLAAKKLKYDTVPVLYADDLSDKEIRAYRIVDNSTAEIATWDFELRDIEMGELPEFDFSEFGEFEDMSVASQNVEVVEDQAPEINEKEEPIARLGDIWSLGRHKLMCGDSTDAASVALLMCGVKADMVFTDPPYQMSMKGAGCFIKSTANMKERIDTIIDFNPESISFLTQSDINSFYFCMNKELIPEYIKIFRDFNFNLLFWGKTNPTPWTNNTFLPDVEYILYFSRKGRVWNNNLKPTSVYKKFYISEKQEGRKEATDIHPTIKPLGLIVDKIRISSNIEGGILDLFGGSGSTLIACEQLNRTCYMMELDPKYIDVILKRYQNLTNDEPTLDGKPMLEVAKERGA